MAGPERAIQVRVLAGWSETGVFTLTAGTKPVSVGTQGQWIIFGEGVAPVHLYFAYDGTSVYVAPASPAQTVLLAGMPLGAGWATATVPTEIRFGGVTLALELGAATALPPSSGPSSPNTVSDGGALWEAAQRAVQAATAAGVQPPQPVASQPFAPPVQGPGPGALASTIVMVPNPAGAILNDALSPLPPPAPLVQGTALAPSGPGFAISNQRQSVPPGAMAAPTMMPSETALAPEWAPQPQGERPTPASTEATAKPGFWQSTSTPKKITLLLMPLVLVASYYLLFAEPPRPPPVAKQAKPPATATATTATSVATSVADNKERNEASEGKPAGPGAVALETTTTTTRTGSSSSRGADAHHEALAGNGPGPAGKSGKSAERTALDLAKSGSYDEAAKAYDALAAQHPEDPTFKDAARILHDKATRSR